MKKTIIALSFILTNLIFSTANAASLKAIMSLGQEGIQQLSVRLAREIGAEGGEQQIQTMLLSTMKILNNGMLPKSGVEVDRAISQFFPKNMLNSELDTIRADKFFEYFNDAAVAASNSSIVIQRQDQFYTLLSCNHCVPDHLSRYGLTVMPQEHPVSRGMNRLLKRDPQALMEPKLTSTLRREARRFDVKMDYVLTKVKSKNTKVALLDSMYRMNSGTRGQKAIGNLVKEMPAGGQLSFFRDTQLWAILVSGNPTDQQLTEIKPLFKHLATVKPANKNELSEAVVDVFTKKGTDNPDYRRLKNTCCKSYGICQILP